MLGQFKKAAFAKQVSLVVSLEEGVRGEVAIRAAGESDQGPRGYSEGKSPHNAVADIELDERDQLRRRRGELLVASVVAVPVKDQMGSENAAPETEAISSTSSSAPASLRKRTTPRWKRVTRNPLPESARPSFFIGCRGIEPWLRMSFPVHFTTPFDVRIS